MGKVIPLTVQNAEIKTASVEIKTLTVAGKQVTLAVFRQLIEEPLISRAGTLNGLPWGAVNYHPNRDCPADRHWHIVWQKGSDLRRSIVPEIPEYGLFRSIAGNQYVEACWRDVISEAIARRDLPWKITQFNDEIEMRGFAEGVEFLFRTSSESVKQTARAYQNLTYFDTQHVHQQTRNGDLFRDGIAKRRTALEAACSALVDDDRDELCSQWLEEIRSERERREQWQRTIQEIASLPQLFIAV